ncbi:MAG: hypothetical protein ACK4TL_05875 [Hyphomicrobiaceae bacterium]
MTDRENVEAILSKEIGDRLDRARAFKSALAEDKDRETFDNRPIPPNGRHARPDPWVIRQHPFHEIKARPPARASEFFVQRIHLDVDGDADLAGQ